MRSGKAETCNFSLIWVFFGFSNNHWLGLLNHDAWMSSELLRVLEQEKPHCKSREAYQVMQEILNKKLAYPELVIEIGLNLMKSNSSLIQSDCKRLSHLSLTHSFNFLWFLLSFFCEEQTITSWRTCSTSAWRWAISSMPRASWPCSSTKSAKTAGLRESWRISRKPTSCLTKPSLFWMESKKKTSWTS